jgi:hypothetical protein
MTAHALTSEALIRRALAAWTDAGLPVGGVEVTPDGTVRILGLEQAAILASARGQNAKGNTCDDIF